MAQQMGRQGDQQAYNLQKICIPQVKESFKKMDMMVFAISVGVPAVNAYRPAVTDAAFWLFKDIQDAAKFLSIVHGQRYEQISQHPIWAC